MAPAARFVAPPAQRQTFVHPFLASSEVVAESASAVPAFLTQIAALVVAGGGDRLPLRAAARRARSSASCSPGVLIGPARSASCSDHEVVEAAAEIGVILLLFTIGIEFSLDRLVRIQRLVLLGGGAAGRPRRRRHHGGAGGSRGVGWRDGVFTGCCFASLDRHRAQAARRPRRDRHRRGQASLGLLIFQDLAVVAMVLVVPMLGGEGGRRRRRSARAALAEGRRRRRRQLVVARG